jgi:hypothetical protein
MEHHDWQPLGERPKGLVRPVRLDPRGIDGPTRGQSRSKLWRRTSRGWHVPSSADASVVEQLILEQSVRLPCASAITAWAALRWRGATYFDGHGLHGTVLAIPVALGGWSDLGRDDALAVSRERFVPAEIEWVAGVPCATVERALFDELRRRPGTREPAVALDMAFAAGFSSRERMTDYLVGRSGWTGVPRARLALRLSSEDSRSPQESRMRLVWILDAGLPPPLCNRPVFDLAGNLLGHPDLFDEAAGLVGEYDGVDHTKLDRRRLDVGREQRFREHGLEYFTVVRGDLADRRSVARRMVNARRRALFLPPGDCAWTLELPAWWLAQAA